MTIVQKLKELGYDTVPESFYDSISAWKSWYDGDVKDFHNYTVFNGIGRVKCHRYTMGMAKKVSEDWANLLMNEKVSITLEGEAEQAFFDMVCMDNNFAVKVNEMQELKSAYGTAAYVISPVGTQINAASGEVVGNSDGLRIDYCIASDIYPISWENGKVKECAFATRKTINNENYAYLQIHKLNATGYEIQNILYKDQNGNLTEADKSVIPGFEYVPDVVYTNDFTPQFIIDRLNIANNIDVSLPLGISVFANAIDQLKAVDIAYDSYVNEFVLGKKRIMVRAGATKDLDGEPVFDPKDTVYYVLPEDVQDGTLISPIDMALRTAEHNAGMQDMLNVLSSKCGFGENHYKYDNGNVSTATQIVSENSSMFRTIKKHEIILEDVLITLAKTVLHMGNKYIGNSLNENVEVSVDFDDSIIEDKQSEFARDLQMLNACILNDWEFRAKYLNEDEETAKAALPGMEMMVSEEQTETE